MRSLLLLSALFSVLTSVHLMAGCANLGKEKEYPSFFRKNILVDGRSGEWNEAMYFFDKRSGVHFALANDSAALYICIRIKEKAEQQKVLLGGMSLYIDPKGKKGRETAVLYPMGMTPERLDQIMNGPGGAAGDPAKARPMLQLRMQDMECTGFLEGNGIRNHRNNPSGILAVVDWDSAGFMVCETRIPLRLFREELALCRPFTAGVRIRGMEQKVQAGENSQGPDVPPGGRDRMPGQTDDRRMDYNSPAPGMDQGADQRMYEDDNFWFPFIIAGREKAK